MNDLENTADKLTNISSTGGAGGILDVFYEDWKLRINEHPKIVDSITELWKFTYASGHPHFLHPHGLFDPQKAFMYIDRICFRVSDDISQKFSKGRRRNLQRSLTPHLDCCPHRLYDKSEKVHPKWRPIQAFIALSDTPYPEMGGFEACRGLHKHFDEWTMSRPGAGSDGADPLPPPCVGEFTPIRPKEDADILSRFEHIPCHAGDLVLWDYRIPHANSRRNTSQEARRVVYIGLLPAIPMNKAYAEYQLERYLSGIVPDDQWHEHMTSQPNSYVFSNVGRKLMTMDSW